MFKYGIQYKSWIVESQNGIYQSIFSTTTKIQNEFPELMKYLDEQPENFLSMTHKGENKKELKNYLDSLDQLLKTYTKEH